MSIHLSDLTYTVELGSKLIRRWSRMRIKTALPTCF